MHSASALLTELELGVAFNLAWQHLHRMQISLSLSVLALHEAIFKFRALVQQC